MEISYETLHENRTVWTTGSGTLLWYEHEVIPVLCNFGGMVYGYASDTVRIWYHNSYPECSTMCFDTTECSDDAPCPIQSHFDTKFISKIWYIGI